MNKVAVVTDSVAVMQIVAGRVYQVLPFIVVSDVQCLSLSLSRIFPLLVTSRRQ